MNIRRGILAPPVLVDIKVVAEGLDIKADAQVLEIGAAATLPRSPAIPRSRDIIRWWRRPPAYRGPDPAQHGHRWRQSALDTRCIFYNQSEWWRDANDHCLKTTGDICHVAPKSHGVCFATFSGDLAPALMTLDADIDLLGPSGLRTFRSTIFISAMRGRTA